MGWQVEIVQIEIVQIEIVQIEIVQIEIVQKPESTKGFVPLAGRWVVERSFGWLNFKRRRDLEKTIASSEAQLQLGFIDILLRPTA